MLLSEEVEVRVDGCNCKYYELLGYEIPKRIDKQKRLSVKRGTTIKVRVEDLSIGSHSKVRVKCDNCGKEINPIAWKTYKNTVKPNGQYFCHKCSHILYAGESMRITKLKNGKSFEQWCVENNRQDILDRWDYKLNDKKPSEIGYANNSKHYFKCPKGVHKSELKLISSFTSGADGVMNCKSCNSFAQWGIDNLGEDFLDKYWDYEKNTVNPWEMSYGSRHGIYIKCQNKSYHESYKIFCTDFIRGIRCPYCSTFHGKVHPLDSLGKLLEDNGLLHLWSDKNKKSPYEYTPMSHEKVWWRCPDGRHEDFKRIIKSSNVYDFHCAECQHSIGEDTISNYLMKYKINYIPQKHYKDLRGSGRGKLSYDFYLPQYNLLIEYQGQQHEKPIDFQGKGDEYAEQQFGIQKIHDELKREYAKEHNIKLLEIWYWDYDNVKQILMDNNIIPNAI